MGTRAKRRRVLVVDIGGTHVKVYRSPNEERRFDSGENFLPRDLIAGLEATTRDWKFDVYSIGFPAPMHAGKLLTEPKHLGKRWRAFNFRRGLGKPVRLINDAAMQALGSYRGGRMLFLGLGTGLGSALLWPNHLLPLELGDLPYREPAIIEEYLGVPGVKLLGEANWKRETLFAVLKLKKAFVADYVVLGGGNVKRFRKLPDGIEPGGNENAYRGGKRLWGTGRQHWRVL